MYRSLQQCEATAVLIVLPNQPLLALPLYKMPLVQRKTELVPAVFCRHVYVATAAMIQVHERILYDNMIVLASKKQYQVNEEWSSFRGHIAGIPRYQVRRKNYEYSRYGLFYKNYLHLQSVVGNICFVV